MRHWTNSQWFTFLTSGLALSASATIGVNVAHGFYPIWTAWPGFLLGAYSTCGIGILVHETRRARETATQIHRVGP